MKLNLKKKSERIKERYSLSQIKSIEAHIEKYFGKIAYVNHEIVSPDIHLDIYVVEPTREKDYYTLITVGMGAHKMNVPKGYNKNKCSRAELIITLPKSWELSLEAEKWYWPTRLLKDLGRLPINSNTWLGYGHTVSNQVQYDESTELSGAYIFFPYEAKNNEKCFRCKISMLEFVNFYQVIPIYEEEMNYKIENGISKFENLFPEDYNFIVDPKRKSFIRK